MRKGFWIAATAAIMSACPAAASEGERDLLTQASFVDRDKAAALRRVQAVVTAVEGDTALEAVLMRATALGYRAKLTGSRSDLGASRKLYEALVKVAPRHAEAQLGLGAWHLGVLSKAGTLLGKMLGANRGAGNAALDRAVALGGDRAFYAGIAGLLRVKADPDDPRGRQLVEQAARAGTPTALDRILNRHAGTVLALLRAGRDKAAQDGAARLLPFGTIPGMAD